MPSYSFKNIARSRIATFDVYDIGLSRHHISALLEFDVTECRKKLRILRKNGIPVTFNGWIIRIIAGVLKLHPEAAAFLNGKRRLILFEDINVSVIIEKKIGDVRVPIPLLIEKADKKSALEISAEIENAKNRELEYNQTGFGNQKLVSEWIYYHLPGILRRAFWRILLGNPGWAFSKMGNVAVTSVGMMGKINGWFIHKTVHPVSFGIGSVLKKPVVSGNNIVIRDILNMTILVDHDVIDGAPMVRFLGDLTERIEKAYETEA